MRWQPILSGVLALALLEVTVSSSAAAGRVGSLLDAVAKVFSHALSPTVAAIPDLRQKGGASTSSSTTTATSSTSSATLPAEWTTSAASTVLSA